MKTKKAKKEFVRKVMNDTPVGQPIKQNVVRVLESIWQGDEYAYYQAKGIANITTENRGGGNTGQREHKGFRILLESGECIRPSYQMGALEPPQKAITARLLREKIRYQIDAFRLGPGDRWVDTALFHVDHDKTVASFDTLMQGWLEEQGLDYVDVERSKAQGDCQSYMSNEEQIESWQKYHEDNAKLQILTAKDNLSGKNKD